VNPPKDFPEEALPPSGKLMPRKLTYQMLEDAVRKAHNKFVAGDWDASKVSAYLATLGIAHVAIKAIIDNADRVLNWEYFQQNKENMMEDFQSIEQDVYANPHLYRQWDRPVMWVRGQDLDQTVDTPMHLLFLGIKKIG
jgi:hypothetical protein